MQVKAKRSRVSGTVCLHLFANLLRYFLGCKADSANVLGEGTLRSNPISHHPGDRQSLHCRYMIRILYRRTGRPKQGRKVKLKSTLRASFPSYFCLLGGRGEPSHTPRTPNPKPKAVAALAPNSKRPWPPNPKPEPKALHPDPGPSSRRCGFPSCGRKWGAPRTRSP